MKLISREAVMTCSLELNEREVKMLSHLASYGGKAVAERICGSITKEFSAEEWDRLFSALREQTEASVTLMRDTRFVFLGLRKAVREETVKEST